MPRDEGCCRVCGYQPGTEPWGEDGTVASFDLCACCGVEFGYQDSLPEGARRFRGRWLASGAQWSDRRIEHDGLRTEERLTRVPAGYR